MAKFIKTGTIAFVICWVIKFIANIIFGISFDIPYLFLITLGIAVFSGLVAVTSGKILKWLFIAIGICLLTVIIGFGGFVAVMLIGSLFTPYGVPALLLLLIYFGGGAATVIIIFFN